ncbi:hypothetical protein H3Z83_05685 [Tenacibaculum sp. S7007]|uniref:Uncharacterized protein n=1 Tax=Tenacibaculum pelagium TaxID=2759527 RepID=A0A839AP70_9FLAO|nr:hypothetical protein [Tenacibaculum pelagium]MBA6156009.1 hypothetical protein [Tenacibaculum pelagium]
MYKEVPKYIFFDGVKQFNVLSKYDNWLSSCEFSVYTNSSIKIDDLEIELFSSNTRGLNEFYLENEMLFEELNLHLNFSVEQKENNDWIIYHSKAKFDDYFLAIANDNDKKYITFYSLGGSRFVESISIYGVFICIG